MVCCRLPQVLAISLAFINAEAFIPSTLSPRKAWSRASKSKTVDSFEPTSVRELDEYLEDKEGRFRNANGAIDYDKLVKNLVVKGDTQMIGDKHQPNVVHPVVQLLHQRRKDRSKDSFKVALAVEGGGMRGCLSAGMVAAIYYLGLEDCIDVIYGSSAGSVIGSYFITRQLQWFGPEIYYDSLTTSGKKFIDPKRLFRAMGLGWLNPALFWDMIARPRLGKPVLSLDFLLKKTMQEDKPLDWGKFEKMQSRQPLKIVASNLAQQKSVIMDIENGSFDNLADMAKCIHASCLLPGIAGPLMNLDTDTNELMLGNKMTGKSEPLADGLFFEPLPYRSAIKEGATHVVVFRTRPDGTDVTGKPSIFEKLILRRFFLRKNKLPDVYTYLRQYRHKHLYGRDVLALNEMARDMDRDYGDDRAPHVMTVAIPPGSPEVSRLETGREAIFEGVRRGFARAYDALVEDPAQRGNGETVARQFFPDEILDYDPLAIQDKTESAFVTYLLSRGENPEAWKARAQTAKTDIWH